MILATEIKEGATLQLDNKLFKVLEVNRHAGSGQMHGFIALKLQDIRYGHYYDRHFKPTDKVEMLELTKRPMNYLYNDEDVFYFMDPENYEQVSISNESIGSIAKFLKEGMRVTVELHGEEALSIQFPKAVELKVSMTGTGIKGGQDNTMKTATLENGMEILVPQFIEAGEKVRVDTEKGKYIDRVPVKRI